jgi:hypothetical protein
LKKLFILLVFIPYISFAQTKDDLWTQFERQIEIVAEGIDQSTEAIENLENNIFSLTAENEEQRILVREAQELIANLKQKNEEAASNILAMNEINIQIANEALEVLKDNERMLRQQKLAGPIAFGTIGLSFGGGFLMANGLNNLDNGGTNQIIAGASIAGGTILIYSLGHYLFSWW